MKIQLVILGLLFCAGCTPTINTIQESTYLPIEDYATRMADEERRQKEIIQKVKDLLNLKDTSITEEGKIITVYTFAGFGFCRVFRCQKDAQGWKGMLYIIHPNHGTGPLIENKPIIPHNGWENLESQLQQLGIKELPSQADFRAEPNTFRPGDKEETVIILDGTSTCIEVQSKELNHYGWYDNIEGYAEARPNSSMLQRMSKIVKLLDQVFLPK